MKFKKKKQENLHDDIVFFFFQFIPKKCTIFFGSMHTAKSRVQKKLLMNNHTDLSPGAHHPAFDGLLLPLIFYLVHKIQTLNGLKIVPMVLSTFQYCWIFWINLGFWEAAHLPLP